MSMPEIPVWIYDLMFAKFLEWAPDLVAKAGKEEIYDLIRVRCRKGGDTNVMVRELIRVVGATTLPQSQQYFSLT